jgi:dihydroxy-acid dehydratase
MSNETKKTPLRSQLWFDNPENREMTALYLERYLNYGLTREELQSGKPIIGIAQTGIDLSPCNRHHIELAKRVRDGIVAAGGIASSSRCIRSRKPASGRRRCSTATSPISGWSNAVRLPARRGGADHRLRQDHAGAADGGGHRQHSGDRALGRPDAERLARGRAHRVGHHRLESPRAAAAGEIDYEQFMEMVASSAPSVGYCNTMGTATTMNSLAEALGMQLPGSAAIPAPYRERGQMAYETGKRIVEMVHEDLKPSDIMTRGGVRERHRRQLGHRRVDQRADPSERHRPPYRASNSTMTTGRRSATTSRCWSTCSPPAPIWARISTAPAAFPPSWRTDEGRRCCRIRTR